MNQAGSSEARGGGSAGRIVLRFPDGSERSFDRGVTPAVVAQGIGPGLARAAVAASLDGEIVDLNRPIDSGGDFRLLTFRDEEGRGVYRHTAAHVLAQAVKRLFPGAKLGIGPAIEDGFYYDFDVPEPFTPDDLERIQEEMSKIVDEDLPLERIELSRDKALDMFRERGEPYKVELIEDLPEDEGISCYRQGDFVDLCAGPHLPSTGRLEAVKLLNAAGAYWRGDERRPMLQRIYGTAFEKQSELDEHLEEARRRDHRVLGRDLEIYSISEEVGPGLILWHPKGSVVRELVEDFWRAEHRKRGYEIVYTPHIAKAGLWGVSGHLKWYKENMYGAMSVEGADYLLKPMNCPFHILIYKARTRSYRELPIRYAELGTVYRYERSGTLHGLLRVRGFTQDDAHIFCRPDQLEDELLGVVQLADFMVRSFGFERYEVDLSASDPDRMEEYAGSEEGWEMAEGTLARVLERMGLDYRREEGEAVFYGPKIDIKLVDALGRGWQGPTIQLDFNLPERFDVKYTGRDGMEHRPFMIHRTVLGAMERFVGTLLEHHGGALPLWLAPVQARVIPVTDDNLDYAWKVRDRLAAEGLRVEVDEKSEKVGYKIRQAELEKVPFMLVVGSREEEAGNVAVRVRGEGDKGPSSLNDVIAEMCRLVEQRR